MADRPAKAEGMNWVNPYLIVKDVKGTLDFYQRVFGFKTGVTMPDKEGNLMHAEMQHKDCVIMLGSEAPEQGQKSPKTLAGSPVSFYLYVDDVDNFFEKVKKDVPEVVNEPTTQYWGDRIAVKDEPA